MKNITKDTWIRTGILVFALINQTLTMMGKPPLPVSDEDLNTFLTIMLTLLASVWSFWKNNSFTKHAIKADQYKDELKFNNMKANEQ